MFYHSHFPAIGKFAAVNAFCPDFMRQPGMPYLPESELLKKIGFVGKHKNFLCP
jgi:hypothetical protein